MPINPSIALQIQPPQMQDPLTAYAKIAGLQNILAQRQMNDQEMQMNRMKIDALRQQMQDDQTVRQVLSKHGGDVEKAKPELLATIGGRALPFLENYAKMGEVISKANKAQLEAIQTRSEMIASKAGAVLDAPPEAKPQIYDQGLKDLVQQGIIAPESIGKEIPATYPGDDILQGILQSAIHPKDQIAQRRERLAQEETARHNKAMEERQTTATPFSVWRQQNPNAPVSEWLKQERTSKLLTPEEEAQQLRLRAASRAQSTGGMQDDAKAIAEDIANGLQPPTTTGLYRFGGPVRAELARRNFDLQKAQTEWNGVQKWMTTANSTQQLRLRQAVEKIEPHVDVIADMYAQLEKKGVPSGFKLWNRAALATARNLPGETGAIATNLEAQINDLAAELGNVYMGGNTPTDHALEQARTNLSTDWNPQTFKMALQLIKKNVALRRNAIRFTGPGGVPSDSPYNPSQFQGQTTPQSQNPSGPKVGDIKTFPNGKKGKWDGTGWEAIP